MASSSKSVRLTSQRKVMDEATRRRRARKALESLEQDNFHDDPHADLVMSKKALSLFQDHGHSSPGASAGAAGQSSKLIFKKKSRNSEYYKQRFRKNFAQLLEEDAATSGDICQGPAQPLVENKKDEKISTSTDPQEAPATTVSVDLLPNANSEQSDDKATDKNVTKPASEQPKTSYISAQVPPSSKPVRHFCAVCGFTSAYTCIVCGTRYCSCVCLDTHRDTRCLKYTS